MQFERRLVDYRFRSQPEDRHDLTQGAGLRRHRLRGGRGLFNQRGVLLRHLVHLRNGGIDLLDAGMLFEGRCSNLPHQVGDTFDCQDYFAYGRPRFDQNRTRLHTVKRVR